MPTVHASGQAQDASVIANSPRQIGRFRVIRRLGSGGFGVVFLAEDPVLRRLVAIKMPLASIFQSQELHDRFLRECRAAAMLNHPGIVRVLESGDVQGVPFQVAEFVDGERLSDLLKRERPTVRWSVEMIRSLADALQHAHEHGVLHRDIKPDNILLQSHDLREQLESPGTSADRLTAVPPTSLPHEARGEASNSAGEASRLKTEQGSHAIPRITDFGLARLADDDAGLSRSGTLVGTPKYMSPEQMEGRIREQGPRTDVYALGVVLHELLTGAVPLGEAEGLQARIAISRTPVPSFRHQCDGISRDLETICLKCLQVRPEDRYASAGELRDDLARYLDGRPTLARPVPVHEQFFRWVILNRKLATLLGLLILSGFVLLAQAIQNDQASSEQNRVLSATLSELKKEKERADTSLRLAEQNRETAERSESRYRDTAWRAQQGEYSAAMMQAASLWKAGEIARMNQVILPFVSAGVPELQGFSCRYLWNQGQILRPFTGHSDTINQLALTPGGQHAFTVGMDNRICRWHVKSGMQEWVVNLGGETPHYMSSCFSQDCEHAVIFRMLEKEEIDEVIVFNLNSRQVEGRRTLPLNQTGDVAISRNGDTVLIGGHKRSESGAFRPFVQVWSPVTDTVVEDSETFRELTIGDQRIPGQTISKLELAADGESVLLAVVADYSPLHTQLLRTTLVKDIAAANPPKPTSIFGPLTPMHWGPGIVIKWKFSPDRRYLATVLRIVESNFKVDMWDLETLEFVGETESFSRSIDSISFDGAGRRLALGVTLPGLNADGVPAAPNEKAVTEAQSEFRLWDFHADTTVRLPYEAKREISLSEPFGTESSNGWFVGLGGGALTMWQPESVLQHHELPGHRTHEVWDLAFSTDGSTLFSAGDDHMLRSWDLASSLETKSTAPRRKLVSCVAVSPDGQWVAAGGYDDDIVVYDAQTLNPIATLKGHTHDIRAIAFSEDGRMLATGGRDKSIRLWNVPAFDMAGVLEGHTDTVRALLWTADGQLVSGGSDRRVLVWDQSGKIARERLEPEGVHSLAFAPAGLQIPSINSNQGTSKSLVNLDHRSVHGTLDHPENAQYIMKINSTELLAIGMNHGTVRTWHIPTDQILFEAQHPGLQIQSVAFSPDGQTLAVAGTEQALHLWHVATGRNVLTFDGLGSSIHRVAFSPDGTQLLAALHDGTIRIWHAPSAAK